MQRNSNVNLTSIKANPGTTKFFCPRKHAQQFRTSVVPAEWPAEERICAGLWLDPAALLRRDKGISSVVKEFLDRHIKPSKMST